jgi:uncharacterized protein YqgV (UPF0045/DUF77 family)
VIGIAAQVSLYPLRQETLSPTVDEALHIFREHGLHVELGAMSSLITGDDAAIFAALQEAFRRAAGQGHVVMVATFSNPVRCRERGERKPASSTQRDQSWPCRKSKKMKRQTIPLGRVLVGL